MDEDASYAVAAGIVTDHGREVWTVFDERARLALPAGYVDWTAERVAEEARAGRTLVAGSVAELAAGMAVPADALAATLDRWNAGLPQGRDPEFLRHETLAAKGRDLAADPLAPIDTAPYYAVRTLPAELAVSHAGMQIDADAAVLDRTGHPVAGLYAAGESAGGLLGVRYIGGGNSIANALVNGRTAGRHAAARAAVSA
jgi:hypothetical protein